MDILFYIYLFIHSKTVIHMMHIIETDSFLELFEVHSRYKDFHIFLASTHG